jgi:hypothetical protein
LEIKLYERGRNKKGTKAERKIGKKIVKKKEG